MRERLLEAWCDGACEPVNPGWTAAWGYVLTRNGTPAQEASGLVGAGPTMSNNVAEYTAVVEALQAILAQPDLADVRVVLRGDSKLWVHQLAGDWRVRGGLYVSTYEQARALLAECRQRTARVALQWIPREENGRADALAARALATAGIRPRGRT